MKRCENNSNSISSQDRKLFSDVYKEEIESIMGSVSSAMKNGKRFELRQIFFEFAEDMKNFGKKLKRDRTKTMEWIRNVAVLKELSISESFQLVSGIFDFTSQILQERFDEENDLDLLDAMRELMEKSTRNIL